MATAVQNSSMIKTGTFTSAATAAYNLVLGFIPQYFLLINTTAVKRFEWIHGMTAAYVFTTETAASNNAYTTSNGFTEYTGATGPTVSSGTTPGNSTGITMGTAVHSSGDVCFYLAIA